MKSKSNFKKLSKVFQVLTKYDPQMVDWRLNAWCFSQVQHTIGTFRKYSPFSYPPQQEIQLFHNKILNRS